MTDNGSRMTIITSRHLSFAPANLFAAFANPDHLKIWWGPNGFTNTIHDYDFRPNGNWHYTMHAPDGSDFINTCTFGGIIPNKKISFVHHLPMHVFTMTMTFEAEQTGTLLTWNMDFEPNDTNTAVRPFIEAANEQNFDRLDAFLRQSSGSAT
jgi:uncharacterized protein YndB with AHSA1/START domain